MQCIATFMQGLLSMWRPIPENPSDVKWEFADICMRSKGCGRQSRRRGRGCRSRTSQIVLSRACCWLAAQMPQQNGLFLKFAKLCRRLRRLKASRISLIFPHFVGLDRLESCGVCSPGIVLF